MRSRLLSLLRTRLNFYVMQKNTHNHTFSNSNAAQYPEDYLLLAMSQQTVDK